MKLKFVRKHLFIKNNILTCIFQKNLKKLPIVLATNWPAFDPIIPPITAPTAVPTPGNIAEPIMAPTLAPTNVPPISQAASVAILVAFFLSPLNQDFVAFAPAITPFAIVTKFENSEENLVAVCPNYANLTPLTAAKSIFLNPLSDAFRNGFSIVPP